MAWNKYPPFQGSSCSKKLRIFLNEKNRLEWYHIDLVKGDNFSKWFLIINPRVVPVLVDDGEVHIENDIIQHLDKKIESISNDPENLNEKIKDFSKKKINSF